MTLPIDDDAGALGKILVSIPEIVLMVDRDGTIRYINRVEPGYDRSQVLGMRSDTIFCVDSRQVFEAALNSVLATGEAEEYEVKTFSPDGSPAWYRARMVPYQDGADVVGAVIVATNITELKAAQEKLARLDLLLSVCAWCGRIRNAEGSWETAEHHVRRTTNTQVTHSICHDCYQRMLDDM